MEAFEDRLPPGDLLFGGLWAVPLGQSPHALFSSERSVVQVSAFETRVPALRAFEEPQQVPTPRKELPSQRVPTTQHSNDTLTTAITISPADDGLVTDLLADPRKADSVKGKRVAQSPAQTGNATVGAGHGVDAVGFFANGPSGAGGIVTGAVAANSNHGDGVQGANAPRSAELAVRAAAESSGVLAFSRAATLGAETPAVHARFDLADRNASPFPSDIWTVPDDTQLTGKRINLPLPDPTTHPSDYEDTLVLNELDGFNLQPRLSIPFDGPINVDTVTSDTVFLIGLANALSTPVVGINQIVWDPPSNTLHVESDELLDQHTRYALIVTNGVHAADGTPIQASESFARFRQEAPGDYQDALEIALRTADRLGIPEDTIVTASVFTTQSATAVLEKIRDQIKAATPAPADFLLGPSGERTVFPLGEVSSVTFNRQISVSGPLSSFDLNLTPIRDIFPGAVGSLVFGKYLSPDYEVHPGEYIPPVRTRTGTPEVQGTNQSYFNLFLPSGPTPAGGWPVAIAGHISGANKNAYPLQVAATMAQHGIATIAINVVGNGFGPLGTLTVNQTVGEPVTFSAGGRGFDQNNDGVIGSQEGLFALGSRQWTIDMRDGMRQTAVDLMQLVRVIEVGMDVDGDGFRDLDPSRIYYSGQSLGGMYGTLFLAVEPAVRVAVPVVPSGWAPEHARLNLAVRLGVGRLLEARVPSLLNAPGITSIDGVPVGSPRFHENMPLRSGIPLAVRLEDGTTHTIRSPVTNTVAGALEIQEAFERAEWAQQSGNPPTYAPHLRKAPLPGVPPKLVIYQIAKGDQNAINPGNTAILRAGDLADRTTFFRNDLAFADDSTVPKNPHLFMTAIANPNPLVAAIARGAQQQIAVFFASDGQTIIHPEPARFFEVGLRPEDLPEGLNFIP